LVGLGLTRRDRRLLVESLHPGRVGDWTREAAIVDLLVELSSIDSTARDLLHALLERRLSREAQRLSGRPVIELLEYWTANREVLVGRELAGLLWVATRVSAAAHRGISLRLAEDVEMLALDCLADRAPSRAAFTLAQGDANDTDRNACAFR
jgi:hypothetical protein